MTVKKMFKKTIQTIKEYPRLLLFALILIVFFSFLRLPLLLQQDSFYPNIRDMDTNYVFSQLGTVVFPEFPPGVLPAGKIASIEQLSNQADNILPWMLFLSIIALVTLLASVFFTPAYLGIIRDAIQKRQPEAGAFFAYGRQFFLKYLAFLAVLVMIIILVSLFLGIISSVIISLTGMGRDAIMMLYYVMSWIIFFFLIFTQFEILEKGHHIKVREAMTRSVKLVASNKLKVLSYLAALLGVEVLTHAAGILLDTLPFIITAILVPLLYGLVTVFLLVALYQVYFNINEKIST